MLKLQLNRVQKLHCVEGFSMVPAKAIFALMMLILLFHSQIIFGERILISGAGYVKQSGPKRLQCTPLVYQ